MGFLKPIPTIRGVSRGKEGFMATNSSIATVAYVADTHVIPSSHIVDNFQNKLASKMGYYLAAVTFILSLSTMPGEHGEHGEHGERKTSNI